MCRWITLLSSDQDLFSLADVVLIPSQSLVAMSVDASFHPGYGDTNNHVMNGDGFGVGWYWSPLCNQQTNGNNVKLAAVFKDTQPAWNNVNLREICTATQSNCIVAHVRAASRNMGISQTNCHPFKAGRLIFCHNGRIFNFTHLRRRMQALLSDEAFEGLRGTTDSETVFALILTNLANDGCSTESPITQSTPFGEKRLVKALKKTIQQIEKVVKDAGEVEYNTMNFSLTDGDSMVATRYCDQSPDVPPPSLYFAFGDASELLAELTQEEPGSLTESEHPKFAANDTSSIGSDTDDTEFLFDEQFVDLDQAQSNPGREFADVNRERSALIVCSNPLTRTHKWHHMPRNSLLSYTRGSLPELCLLTRRKASLYVKEQQ
jgi:glutamine amidotransferase